MDRDDPVNLTGGFTVSPEGGFPEREPFGTDWPGLAPAADGGGDPDGFADRHVPATDDGTSRIMLVPAARSADVLTAVGWRGAVNHIQEKFLLSAVLRSWEDRFGARVVEIGFDTINLAVAAPPVSPEQAELVAAEHFAFCPDNIAQGMSGTVRAYAANEVLGKESWSFWWD
jgi:hypothetical protein